MFWNMEGQASIISSMYCSHHHGGGSIMVWGCMSAADVGYLTVYDGILNSGKYCGILETRMLLSACAPLHPS